MIDHMHYVPILKGRYGEYGALHAMSADDKETITPVVEIPPIPWDFKNDQPAKTIDQHLLKVDSNLERSWGIDRALYVDLLEIGETERMRDGTHPLTYVFEKARKKGVQAIPVTGFAIGDDYQLAIRDIIKDDRRGVCLRLQREDFEESNDLHSQISALLNTLHVPKSETDLILDLRALNLQDRGNASIDVPSMIRSLPHLQRWRSFVLGATAFPVDLMGLPPSEISVIPRSEWILWKDLVVRRRVPRLPTFSDYGISHPQPSEVDPRVMRASASIRYTTEKAWLILKGKNLKDHGYNQFHDVSNKLLNKSEYSGPEFSWGDRYICECASRRVSSGNLTTWRKVGTSHHIAYVRQQLATLASS